MTDKRDIVSTDAADSPDDEGRALAAAREVAALAEVSVSTVSRVFRGSTKVTPRTTERVLKAAEQIGYSPNLAARALRTGKAQAVGFVLRNPYGLLGEFHAKSFGGFESTMADKGMRIVVAAVNGSAEMQDRCRELFSSHQCGGVVVQADELSVAELAELGTLRVPVVAINYDGRGTDLPKGMATVGFDNALSIRTAMRHLLALGHRRIGFIGGTPTTNDAVLREQGFRDAIASMKIDHHEQWIRPGHFGHREGGFESGRSQMEYILGEVDGPTAIVCASDEIAVGALNAIRHAGREVPRDYSIVGYDNHSWTPHINPPLTTIAHDGWDLGVRAATALLTMLAGEKVKDPAQIVETRLVVRSSTVAVRS